MPPLELQEETSEEEEEAALEAAEALVTEVVAALVTEAVVASEVHQEVLHVADSESNSPRSKS